MLALETLRVERISRASACQRAGRAGRERAGTCARLYTEEECSRAMPERATAEVRRSALAGIALEMLALGLHRPDAFDWLEPPPRAHMRHALHTLKLLSMPCTVSFTTLQNYLYRELLHNYLHVMHSSLSGRRRNRH